MHRVAPSEASVLLLGESGTGKELVAQAIHESSEHAGGPFVPVECAGLTDTLFETELFGHEKGAFTGAIGRKVGLIESARGGTLFLDEVGDIPLGIQVKLLRLLETGTYRRVGGTEPLEADFRLICATHRDLPAMVANETFRGDLYFRISVFPILLPALRERLEDLPLLVDALLRRIPSAVGKRLSPEALHCMEHYAFPGNIRELRNFLERASLLADDENILAQHLPQVCHESRCRRAPGLFLGNEILPLDELERRYLQGVVARYEGDRKELAALLGVSERTLYRKLQGLHPADSGLQRQVEGGDEG
jgi:DNA-binding NtrC family response regulator